MISYWNEPFFPEGPPDWFYTRIRCYFDTYGAGKIAEFWIQTQEGETTAWIGRWEDSVTVSARPHADFEELAEFVSFLGGKNVIGPPELCLPDGFLRQQGESLRYVGGASVASSEEILENPSGDRLYRLLSACQSDSLLLPSRDGFLSDYARRVRLGTGRAKLLCRDGVDVALAMTTAEAPDSALLGGVACLPSYRGQGLATVVLTHLAEELARENKQVFLAAGTAELAEFYKRRGFVGDGVWCRQTASSI